MNFFTNRCMYLLLYYILYLIGLTFFIFGFTSTKVDKIQPVSKNSLLSNCFAVADKNVCQYQEKAFNSLYFRHYEKFVLIIIDALRADFIPSVSLSLELNLELPFTESLIRNGSALSLINTVFSPTVTLPRIKTLVSGSVSNFMDVLINFNASKLYDDNFLLQATLKNLKAVFYGDDTWLKLFPELFIRSEGTHSFFVSDFSEVDTNVTRHLADELSKEDWNIMILHYLGVDHIGHAFGPNSEYLAPKLKEMDTVIEHIYEKLKHKSKMPSLMIVCGDHGMTSSGSHGGVTKNELLTPLVFINTNCSECLNSSNIKTVSQVDFAVTLSILMGIPIPVNSLGNIIPEVLHFSNLTPQQILNAAFYNLLQLLKVYEHLFPSEKNIHYEEIKNIIWQHYKWLKNKENKIVSKTDEEYIVILNQYMTVLQNKKQQSLAKVSGYNIFSMITGIFLLWFSLLFGFFTIVSKRSNIIPEIYFSSSVLSIFILLPIVITINTWHEYLQQGIYIFISLVSIFVLNKLYCIVKHLYIVVSLNFMEKILMLFYILHISSLFSSSYTEEEHQTWYFFTSSILILFFINVTLSVLNSDAKIRREMDLNFLWNVLRIQSTSDKLYTIMILLVSHRILRSWNQTGNKWQHLPDISDWLNQEQNFQFCSLIAFIAIITIIFFLKEKCSHITFYAACFGLLLTYLYKFEKSLHSQNSMLSTILIPWLIYAVIIFIICFALFRFFVYHLISNSRSNFFIYDFISAWILLVILISRFHNIPLISAIMIQERLLNKLTWENNQSRFCNISCYLIMSTSSFYSYGNSNSLATIDVYSGYTGLSSYKPILVGFLIVCNTYSTVVLWLILMIYRMLKLCNNEGVSSTVPQQEQKIVFDFLILVIYRLFVLAVYCSILYIMKHHLFVLSVFAPKCLYEFSHTILFTFILVCLVLTIYIKHMKSNVCI